jgi:hypothetical protein
MECTKDEEGFQSLVQKYFVPEDVVQSVKEEVSALSSQEAIREFDHWVDTCHLEKEDGAQHREEIQTVINRWKGEYIRLCQI